MNYAFSLQNGFNPYINIYIFMLAIDAQRAGPKCCEGVGNL